MLNRFSTTALLTLLLISPAVESLAGDPPGTEPTATSSRKRAVRAVIGNPTPPPTSDCVTFAPIRAGLKAGYRSTSPTTTADYTITWVSDSSTQSTIQEQSPSAFGTVMTDLVIDYAPVASPAGELRSLTKAVAHVVAPSPIGQVTVDATITFVPTLVLGPAAGWCAGAIWTIPTSTVTVVASTNSAPASTTVTNTFEATGKVVATHESVTVPAGTFDCLRYEGVTFSGTTVSRSVVWTSTTQSIMIRQESTDPTTGVVTVHELTSLQ